MVTPSGILILVKLLQFWNAKLPILVTLPGKVISVRLLHPLKVSLLIEAIPSGIFTLARLLQL